MKRKEKNLIYGLERPHKSRSRLMRRVYLLSRVSECFFLLKLCKL